LRIVEMANCGRILSAARARKVAVYSSFVGKKVTALHPRGGFLRCSIAEVKRA